MISKKKWVLIIALVLVVSVAGIALFTPRTSNTVESYANSKHLPSDIVEMLKPLDKDKSMDTNEKALVDELSQLGNYTNSPMVRNVVGTIVSHGNLSYVDRERIQDVDTDGITNKLEMTKYHTDPTNIYSSGLNLDDFNAIFTYGIDPNNQTLVKEVIAKVPNVVVNHWPPDDGGTPFSTQKFVDISARDPLIQYLANKAEIKWPGWGPEGKIGMLYVDGSPIWKADKDNQRSVDQPSYYFTHGRSGNCVESTIVNLSILKLMGIKSIGVGNKVINQDVGHETSEAVIDGKVYVVDSSGIFPREGFYTQHGLTPDSSYDPNWYQN